MQDSQQHDDAEQLLTQGIEAIKAGDFAQARNLLAQAIQLNPADDRFWLWMSGAVETDHDRYRCLERALQLNPHNTAAKRGIAAITNPPKPKPKPKRDEEPLQDLFVVLSPPSEPVISPPWRESDPSFVQPETQPEEIPLSVLQGAPVLPSNPREVTQPTRGMHTHPVVLGLIALIVIMLLMLVSQGMPF
jgi:hypothetical protein